ncbi:MAG: class I SAM-dependent methyltransferase [Bacteroidetes bacterium]|nr:class I SAM-dependent methyltransferase [Bacteroidota bacterium]
MHELPANHHPIAIMGHQEQLVSAEAFLLSKGYQLVDKVLADSALFSNMGSNTLLEKGCHSSQLWQANPLLQEVISRVENRLKGRTALDLAAGAGRDSVYLAKRGWQVTALDINEDSLQRCQHLAKVNQVELTTLQRDLEGSSPEMNTLSADLVLVMRYLHRPLFPVIDRMIRPGGALIYSTFMIGCEQFGSPRNPNYLLKPGELNSTFSNYQVIVDEQRKLADGRPVTLFVGIKDPNNNS